MILHYDDIALDIHNQPIEYDYEYSVTTTDVFYYYEMAKVRNQCFKSNEEGRDMTKEERSQFKKNAMWVMGFLNDCFDFEELMKDDEDFIAWLKNEHRDEAYEEYEASTF